MRILITGACGFVGTTLCRALRASAESNTLQICGIDNLSRPGSETNRSVLKQLDVHFVHGDIRVSTDLDTVGDVDWVIDAAANPSVLAGVDGQTSSRQLVAHNLEGTINLLEFCKVRTAGFVLLSTSRVYSIASLARVAVEPVDGAFRPVVGAGIAGFSECGVNEAFSTSSPVSLYGATKLASEQLALEYGSSFGFPVWINRCGVLAGAGQFGRADQGIFSFWINAWLRNHPLRYIGFDGSGCQVRDCLHPRDLLPLLRAQMSEGARPVHRVINVGGGVDNSLSLAQLSKWCAQRFGQRDVEVDPTQRPFDVPWVVMDCSQAQRLWNWQPQTPLTAVLSEIADHAVDHPQWLELSR